MDETNQSLGAGTAENYGPGHCCPLSSVQKQDKQKEIKKKVLLLHGIL
jgi:hypothetical protein